MINNRVLIIRLSVGVVFFSSVPRFKRMHGTFLFTCRPAAFLAQKLTMEIGIQQRNRTFER